jgi:N-acyl-D-amino-acid deacylase
VRYYAVNDKTGVATVGPGAGEKEVPVSYGVWRQETLDAHGGWIATAPDLAKFAAAFDLDGADGMRAKLLTRQSVETMFRPHVLITAAADDKPSRHYGLGWFIEPVPGEEEAVIARHGGALACTAASLMHFPDGTNLAVLFNLGKEKEGKFLGRGFEGSLTEVVMSVKDWP